MQQLKLMLASHGKRGGARAGAGRPRLRSHLRHTEHRARPAHRAAQPVHVTLRAISRSLRSQQVAPTVLRAVRDSQRESFRVAHYSLQDNHLHLLVEAERQGVSYCLGCAGSWCASPNESIACSFGRGTFWADRWHGRALTSPRQVRNALVYVLNNRAKHSRQDNGRSARSALVGRVVLRFFRSTAARVSEHSPTSQRAATHLASVRGVEAPRAGFVC